MPAKNQIRPLYEIAKEIRKDWGAKTSEHAKPYIREMAQFDKITDKGFSGDSADDADGIVKYFLNNASTWRGDVAKRVKAELKAML